MTHRFHPEAAAEFEDAVRYYRSRGRTLGQRLSNEVRTTIRRILVRPQQFRIIEGEVRRCFVRVFPYSVLYTIEPDSVLIIAIAHAKREPGYWKERLPPI